MFSGVFKKNMEKNQATSDVRWFPRKRPPQKKKSGNLRPKIKSAVETGKASAKLDGLECIIPIMLRKTAFSYTRSLSRE